MLILIISNHDTLLFGHPKVRVLNIKNFIFEYIRNNLKKYRIIYIFFCNLKLIKPFY
jgi:hypothetical protein